MKTIVIANQKGGVGKTSILVHLAFDFLERGLKVLVLDLDIQANASYTLQHFAFADVQASDFLLGRSAALSVSDRAGELVLVPADNGLADSEKFAIDEAITGLKQSLAQAAGQGFDVCLIDTAPSLGNSLVAALACGDFVMSPIELEIYSTQGVQKMNATIAGVRKAYNNPKLKFLGMFPSKVDKRNPRHQANLALLSTSYPSLVAPVGIGLRSSVAEAISDGVPVWQIRKTAARTAAAEMRAMAAYVFDKVEMSR
jgi:chromosome partitioning protein